jgi:hypothetical protein
MNEKQLDRFKDDWKKWAKKDLFVKRGPASAPSRFNFDKALLHLRVGRQKVRELASAVQAWQPIFPKRLLPQDKYQDQKASSYWKTKAEDNLVEADGVLVKGIRHLETLLGYYETEQQTEDTSYLEDYAERNEADLERVIMDWGREDFDDSVEGADKILSNRVFRNLKSIMSDLRDAERAMQYSEAKAMANEGFNEWFAMLPDDDWGERVAFFQSASEAELSLEQLFISLLPETPFEHKVFAVGGYVRDEVLGREPHDLDIVVEAQYGAQRFADYLHDLFPNSTTEPEPVTLEYPIWKMSFTDDVEWDGQVFEVRGADLDLADTQTILDEGTVFGPLGEDVKRRDFTTNMLFKDLTTGEILDPTGYGLRDIEQGLLRVYPDQGALDAFRAEPKRMLRLVRFMARYDWMAEPEVEKAIEEAAPYLAELKPKSVEKELHKLHQDGNLDNALDVMEEYGMLPYLGEALRTYDETQRPT